MNNLLLLDKDNSTKYYALVEACDQVQRAFTGDGITMAEAVDACLLALAAAKGK